VTHRDHARPSITAGQRSRPDFWHPTGRESLNRLVGAVLAEQSDEWTEGRRYMSLDVLAKSRIRIISNQTDTATQPAATTDALTA
jgi:hypothetical protein